MFTLTVFIHAISAFMAGYFTRETVHKHFQPSAILQIDAHEQPMLTTPSRLASTSTLTLTHTSTRPLPGSPIGSAVVNSNDIFSFAGCGGNNTFPNLVTSLPVCTSQFAEYASEQYQQQSWIRTALADIARFMDNTTFEEISLAYVLGAYVLSLVLALRLLWTKKIKIEPVRLIFSSPSPPPIYLWLTMVDCNTPAWIVFEPEYAEAFEMMAGQAFHWERIGMEARTALEVSKAGEKASEEASRRLREQLEGLRAEAARSSRIAAEANAALEASQAREKERDEDDRHRNFLSELKQYSKPVVNQRTRLHREALLGNPGPARPQPPAKIDAKIERKTQLIAQWRECMDMTMEELEQECDRLRNLSEDDLWNEGKYAILLPSERRQRPQKCLDQRNSAAVKVKTAADAKASAEAVKLASQASIAPPSQKPKTEETVQAAESSKTVKTPQTVVLQAPQTKNEKSPVTKAAQDIGVSKDYKVEAAKAVKPASSKPTAVPELPVAKLAAPGHFTEPPAPVKQPAALFDFSSFANLKPPTEKPSGFTLAWPKPNYSISADKESERRTAISAIPSSGSSATEKAADVHEGKKRESREVAAHEAEISRKSEARAREDEARKVEERTVAEECRRKSEAEAREAEAREVVTREMAGREAEEREAHAAEQREVAEEESRQTAAPKEDEQSLEIKGALEAFYSAENQRDAMRKTEELEMTESADPMDEDTTMPSIVEAATSSATFTESLTAMPTTAANAEGMDLDDSTFETPERGQSSSLTDTASAMDIEGTDTKEPSQTDVEMGEPIPQTPDRGRSVDDLSGLGVPVATSHSPMVTESAHTEHSAQADEEMSEADSPRPTPTHSTQPAAPRRILKLRNRNRKPLQAPFPQEVGQNMDASRSPKTLIASRAMITYDDNSLPNPRNAVANGSAPSDNEAHSARSASKGKAPQSSSSSSEKENGSHVMLGGGVASDVDGDGSTKTDGVQAESEARIVNGVGAAFGGADEEALFEPGWEEKIKSYPQPKPELDAGRDIMEKTRRYREKAAKLREAQAQLGTAIPTDVSQQATIPASSNAGTVAAGSQQDLEETDEDGWEEAEQSGDEEAGTSDDSASQADNQDGSNQDGSDQDGSDQDDDDDYNAPHGGGNTGGDDSDDDPDDTNDDLGAIGKEADAKKADRLGNHVDSDPPSSVQDLQEDDNLDEGTTQPEVGQNSDEDQKPEEADIPKNQNQPGNGYESDSSDDSTYQEYSNSAVFPPGLVVS